VVRLVKQPIGWSIVNVLTATLANFANHVRPVFIMIHPTVVPLLSAFLATATDMLTFARLKRVLGFIFEFLIIDIVYIQYFNISSILYNAI